MSYDYQATNVDDYNAAFGSQDSAPFSKATAGQTANPDALSVTDALLIAKTGLESIKVKIIGEVSEVSDKRGYKAVYFTIKDNKSSLPCLMWLNKYDACGVKLTVGAMVELAGRFSLYPAKGRMNFSVDFITLAGEGQLRMQVAMLAKKLEAEGLTDSSKKKPIPQIPLHIGLVTSPRGAVVHDVIRTLNRRMPIAKVYFAGCAVEGSDAPLKMIDALRLLDSKNLDVILLCRGGGSFEDLMPFNDEALARTIYELSTPIVTGIGHEPDTTIADLVSDFRASTPTGAAESVSFNATDFMNSYSFKVENIKTRILSRLKASEEKLNQISSRPIFADGTQLFASEFQHLDYVSEKLTNMMKQFSDNYNQKISLFSAKLHDKSPLVVLSRGYSATMDMQGKIISSVDSVSAGQDIKVKVSDGTINAKVQSCEKNMEDLL